MEIDYRILNLYKTKQYDECLKLCALALNDKSDRMIEFIQMRAMTIQAKIAGNGYEEVEYFPQQDELTSTSIAKTPRPGTTFQREVKTAQTNVRLFFLICAWTRQNSGTIIFSLFIFLGATSNNCNAKVSRSNQYSKSPQRTYSSSHRISSFKSCHCSSRWSSFYSWYTAFFKIPNKRRQVLRSCG